MDATRVKIGKYRDLPPLAEASEDQELEYDANSLNRNALDALVR